MIDKDALRRRLEYLVNHVPKSVWSASVNKTRQWKDAQKAAMKVFKSKSSTETELQSAINKLEVYE